MEGIINNAKVKKLPRIFIYGTPGIGKTTFAAHFPNPVFICTEDGLADLPVDRFPIAKDFDSVTSQLEKVKTEKHDYKTLVLDSVDWLQSLVFEHVADLYGKSRFADIGYGAGYRAAADIIGNTLETLDNIMYQRGMTIVLTGHSIIRTYTNPIGPDYDQYAPDLHEKILAPVSEWADITGFMNYDAFVKKDEGKATGSGERTLYLQQRPGYIAKNRYSLPESIEIPKDNPALGVRALGAAIKAGKTKVFGGVTPEATETETAVN